ncbi:MAG: hypothetical protein CL961_00230 [Euryarchaeota archaeon]|nr:hypothetical protein [Euryarchaeota archaeon]|tara:strand:- start:8180 stop:8419 length:240 start_codon:yes stop_codon:yes gene_type:complete
MPETPKENIDTYLEGLKSAERKPTSKTPFVATVLDQFKNKVRRPLTVVSFKSEDKEDLKINDSFLHDVGVSVSLSLLPD